MLRITITEKEKKSPPSYGGEYRTVRVPIAGSGVELRFSAHLTARVEH